MSLRCALAASALACGCAAAPHPAPGPPPLGPAEVRSARAAQQAIVPGRSTKAEVRAALGEGTAVDFDNGYSAWVYREPVKEKGQSQEKGQPPHTELVILFSPAGVVSKTRVR